MKPAGAGGGTPPPVSLDPLRAALPAGLLGEQARAAARRLGQGLFPHQVEGVAFLLERGRAILADDMGLGKTRQAVVALSHAAPSGPWLVVCPASVKHSWAREIAVVEAAAQVAVVGPAAPPGAGYTGWVIVNYDILARQGPALLAHAWAGCVLDEAHYLKNYRSRRSRAARGLLARVPAEVPVYLLTGTPLTNRPRDLFPLLQIIGHPLGRDFLAFARRYCDARHNGFGWVTDGASNLEELTVQLHGALLRRDKTRVLSLPPKLVGWREVDLPGQVAVRQTRQALRELLRSTRPAQGGQSSGGRAGPDGDGAFGPVRRQAREHAPQPAAARLSAGPRGGRRGSGRARALGHLTTARRLLAAAKVRTTLELTEAAVDQGDKVLVYSCFGAPLRRVREHFGAQALLLTGEVPAAQRQALVDRFQTDPGIRVFCANLLAGGVGVTLTAARQVVFNDLDWVPANHWQAEDRACRIGQRRSVNVHYVLARGTLDEFLAAMLETKRRLIRAVVDGEGLGEAGADVLAELERALRLAAPGVADLSDAELEQLDVAALVRDLAQSVPPAPADGASRS